MGLLAPDRTIPASHVQWWTLQHQPPCRGKASEGTFGSSVKNLSNKKSSGKENQKNRPHVKKTSAERNEHKWCCERWVYHSSFSSHNRAGSLLMKHVLKWWKQIPQNKYRSTWKKFSRRFSWERRSELKEQTPLPKVKPSHWKGTLWEVVELPGLGTGRGKGASWHRLTQVSPRIFFNRLGASGGFNPLVFLRKLNHLLLSPVWEAAEPLASQLGSFGLSWEEIFPSVSSSVRVPAVQVTNLHPWSC